MRILIGIPSSGLVKSEFAFNNLPQIVSHAKKLPNVYIAIMSQRGVRTDRNRNEIIQSALQNEFDAILWLDEDMLYPENIVEKYVESNKDIIGCLYFRRSEPHPPVAYVLGDNPKKPYLAIDLENLPIDNLVEVDAIGYGGLFVKTTVYDFMRDKKWTHYGENYHLPFECEGRLTHDLQFCKEAKEHGFKVYMHTGVKATHLGDKYITEKDWVERDKPKVTSLLEPKVTVIMPAIDLDKAQKAAQLMSIRAGYQNDIIIVEDVKRTGFVKTLNEAVKKYPSHYYVYTAEDAYVGKDWLKIAMNTLLTQKKGLFAFNNGRWFGELASFGLISYEFFKDLYNGDMMCPLYNAHYGDTELTVIAKAKDMYCYNSDSLMVEVDYDKDKKSVNRADKDLFNIRKLAGFDGLIDKNNKFINNFS